MPPAGVESVEPLPAELPNPFPNREVVDQGHGKGLQIRTVAAELPHHRPTVRTAAESEHPIGGFQNAGFLPIGGCAQEEVVVLARTGVHAHAVDPILHDREDLGDPDAVWGDVSYIHPAVLVSKHDGLFQERSADQGVFQGGDLLRREPVLEHDLTLPIMGFVVLGGRLEVVLEPVNQPIQIAPSSLRELRIRFVKNPAYQLRPDLRVVGGVVANERLQE